MKMDIVLDMLDTVYELVDSLTYKLRRISPGMWPVFEATYRLFKSDAIDFLEGTNFYAMLMFECYLMVILQKCFHLLTISCLMVLMLSRVGTTIR